MTPDTKHTTVEADGVVRREVDDEEREVLRVPISSTRSDREGDRFSKDALDGMAEQIREEQPLVFQNHGLAGNWMEAIPYDQAETIGTHFDAEVVEADDDEHELHAFINPDGTHPEGERMLKQVRDEGQAVKFSVGFGIKDAEPIEDEAGNEVGREFQRVDLMEDSKVGIPANPDASVSTASAKGAGVAPGFAMHPAFRAMLGEDHHAHGMEEAGAFAAKDAMTDGGEPDDVAELREEVDALRSTVEDLSAAVGDIAETLEDDDDEDDDDDDDDDDDGEEESAAGVDDDLRERIEALEESLADGHGESKTGDPTDADPPTDKSDEPDEGADADEPGETNDDTPDHETLL